MIEQLRGRSNRGRFNWLHTVPVIARFFAVSLNIGFDSEPNRASIPIKGFAGSHGVVIKAANLLKRDCYRPYRVCDGETGLLPSRL